MRIKDIVLASIEDKYEKLGVADKLLIGKVNPYQSGDRYYQEISKMFEEMGY
ncbi:MAG: hypothetical protein P8X70_00360 [Nanoarchaeota archaeon]